MCFYILLDTLQRLARYSDLLYMFFLAQAAAKKHALVAYDAAIAVGKTPAEAAKLAAVVALQELTVSTPLAVAAETNTGASRRAKKEEVRNAKRLSLHLQRCREHNMPEQTSANKS